MGSESLAHDIKGHMGYWLKGHESERNNTFSKIQLVGQMLSQLCTWIRKPLIAELHARAKRTRVGGAP